LYRPFTKQSCYFDAIFLHRLAQFPIFVPTKVAEEENSILCLPGPGSEKPFHILAARGVVDLHLSGAGASTECFAFYIYDEDGTNRRENITDWALNEFRTQYKDQKIGKWDIFHYVYGVLHSPEYRERYAANLKRELPRIPFAPDFWGFAKAGERLADLHVNYEKQPEYPLQRIENPKEKLNWRVEKMRLSKDKTLLIYNQFWTLSGIPPETYEYRLGNRSALEWIVDQYQVSTDKRSGITNDPNRQDDPTYILRLIGQVITVSLETVKIIRSFPSIGMPA
jgi:predicted helicase